MPNQYSGTAILTHGLWVAPTAGSNSDKHFPLISSSAKNPKLNIH